VYSIDPIRFFGDPSFDYGNQGSLGLFSPILGLFLETFGVSTGAFLYTLLTQLFWIVAFVFLIKNLLWLNWQRLWILPTTILSICIFSNGMPFSHISFFNYLSTYVCSRSLSIALGLSGVALVFKEQKCLSFLLFLIGTAVHPLTAGWGIPFWMFYFCPKTRIPILVCSLIFPFSCLIHSGVLDVYPVDWLAKPLNRPRYELSSLYAFLLVFWGMLAKRTFNKRIQNISLSMWLLTVIALYWDLWGSYGEHIFLYQVQPWRALWLPSIVAAPLGICHAKDAYRNFTKKKIITSYNLATILLFVSFFTPVRLFSVSITAVILFLLRERVVTSRDLVVTYAGILFGGYIVQQYITWSLQGFPAIYILSIKELCYARDAFFMYQAIFALGFVFLFIRKRLFLSAIVLAISVFFARFMLLPVLALFVAFFQKKTNVWYWIGVCLITFLVIFDGLFDVDARSQFLFHGLPFNFFKASLLALLSFVAIWLTKKVSYKSIVMWLVICSSFAIAGYVDNFADILNRERQLDLRLHQTIFPQIEDRGHVLFYVSGDYFGDPRLQFMTGCYLNYNVMLGSVFFEGQYKEALKRSRLLYWRERSPESNQFVDYMTILGKLGNPDTLTDRVEFLCRHNEIHHLVTSNDSLPFIKEDSTIIGDMQKVFLYDCSSTK